jgi:hypothetical protein
MALFEENATKYIKKENLGRLILPAVLSAIEDTSNNCFHIPNTAETSFTV